MAIGLLILAAGVAGLITIPLTPGGAGNTAVLLVLLLAVVGGGAVALTGSIQRLIHTFKTVGLFGIKARPED